MRQISEELYEELMAVVKPLITIADAYDENALDDEARKFCGKHDELRNIRPPEHIELYQGRGGRQLLTLADCMRAREVVGKLMR